MKKSTLALALLLAAARPAFAADKTHQQIMAEIRMLQEQQQQLQQTLAALGDTLKTVTAKLDEQSGVSRKSFADQKLLIDNVVEGVRILREKSDDTNVRLSVMTQEMESVRQALAAMPPAATPVAAAETPAGTTPPGAPPAGTQPPVAPPPVAAPPTVSNVSPQRLYDTAYSDYAGGQLELAVTGFEQYIRSYPKSVLADDAQLNIGNAYYQGGRFQEAIAAFQKVISDYPESDSIATAYYKMGVTYEAMKRLDLARKAYDTVVQKFPTDVQTATLAKQALDRLNRK